MKRLSFYVFLIIFVSCKSKNKVELASLKFSGYQWVLREDSVRFYLGQYLDMNSDGEIRIMRHETFMDAPKYFADKISDSLKIAIDSFIFREYKTNYIRNESGEEMYHGFKYCIDYTLKNGKRQRIQFIPGNCPNEVQKFYTLLHSRLKNSYAKEVPFFDLQEYENDLTIFTKQHLPPFPKYEDKNFFN